MSVVGELVKAEIRLHSEPSSRRCPGDADSAVEDAVRVGRARPCRVTNERHTEQHDAAEPGIRRRVNDLRQRLERFLPHSRHRRDGLRFVPLGHEHGEHEGGCRQRVLSDESAHRGALSQAPRAVGGIGRHGRNSGVQIGERKDNSAGKRTTQLGEGQLGEREDSSARRDSMDCSGAVSVTVRARRSASRVVPGPSEARTVFGGSTPTW